MHGMKIIKLIVTLSSIDEFQFVIQNLMMLRKDL